MNRKLLNEYINKYKISDLTEYISNINNLQEEKLSIKLIDTFENNQLTINTANEFIIILNNSIHDLITINKIDFEEVLIINDISNIVINSELTYSDIKYILVENISKKNSIEEKNRYLVSDNIFLINESNILNYDDCNFIMAFIDNYKKNNLLEKSDWNCNSNSQSLFCKISENYPNKILNKKVNNLLLNVIEKLVSYLKKENQIAKLNNIVCDSGYQFRKIFGETCLHYDGIKESHNDTNERFLSVIICLNDDYEGGEICFPVQNRNIKLKKGDILAFPPYWTHPYYSNDLLNKTYKYSVNTWLY